MRAKVDLFLGDDALKEAEIMSYCLGCSCWRCVQTSYSGGQCSLGTGPQRVQDVHSFFKPHLSKDMDLLLAVLRRLNWRPLEAPSTNSKHNSRPSFVWKKL